MKLVPAGIATLAIVALTACSPTATTSSTSAGPTAASPTMSATTSSEPSTSTSADPSASVTTSGATTPDVTTSSTTSAEPTQPDGEAVDSKEFLTKLQTAVKSMQSYQIDMSIIMKGTSENMMSQVDRRDSANPKSRTAGTVSGTKFETIVIGKTAYELQPTTGKYKQRAATATEMRTDSSELSGDVTKAAANMKIAKVGQDAKGTHYRGSLGGSMPSTMDIWVNDQFQPVELNNQVGSGGTAASTSMKFSKVNEDQGIVAPDASKITK